MFWSYQDRDKEMTVTCTHLELNLRMNLRMKESLTKYQMLEAWRTSEPIAPHLAHVCPLLYPRT
jgi:hypothetical protein